MLLYALICLSLALVGVAGLQFMYLFYLDRIDQERKKRIYELEHQCRHLTARLEEAETRIAEQEAMVQLTAPESEEAWADVIDER